MAICDFKIFAAQLNCGDTTTEAQWNKLRLQVTRSNYCLYSKSLLQSEDLYNVNKLPPTISIENFVKFLDKQQNTTWNFAPLSRERCQWEGRGKWKGSVLLVSYMSHLSTN